MTLTIDGYIGDTNLQAAVFTGVSSFTVDSNQQLLTMNFSSGRPPTFVDISTAATMTVTLASNYVTAAAVAD